MRFFSNTIFRKRSFVVIALLTAAVIFFVKCTDAANDKKNAGTASAFEQYAGSEKCISCHKNIYDTHLHTEHHLSTAIAAKSNISGSFDTGMNKLIFNPTTYVAMEDRDSGLYQVQYIYDEEEKSERFDITVGSGRKGQSYLSWIGKKLAQLPVTYFTPAKQWSTSPGYPSDKVAFDRPITARCLECHSTYFEVTSAPDAIMPDFDKQKIIYGIECEKCHGPAAEHVKYQTEHPQEKQAKFIVNTGKLSRQQSLDLCGLCHGGRLTKKAPSFSFKAGDSLSTYFTFEQQVQDAANMDVHGNQLGLLRASKCYLNSQMTCISCHNTHENEKDKLQVFSQRCMTCHDATHTKSCKLTAAIGPAITQNCIDCHMPKQSSRSIAVNLQGVDTLTPVMMRNHFIKIYPSETDKVKKRLREIKAIQP
jgi:hypothetical protein